jgi:hypothetical protein
MKNLKSTIINPADNNDPAANDLFAQTATIKVGDAVPDGWRVLSGNNNTSTIARVAMRHEVEELEEETQDQETKAEEECTVCGEKGTEEQFFTCQECGEPACHECGDGLLCDNCIAEDAKA